MVADYTVEVRNRFKGLALIVEKAMAPHSSTLAWKLPWMEEPGRLQSIGSQRVGHDIVIKPLLPKIRQNNYNNIL